ncbi:hypothetical protein GCM10009799_48170 [Nocardiopsis rhodophaea]|uniref:Uncharacterized protein n=1 Tax=Nocardiopsis rhodophaea TaxID=280238 RepID=A0ABN2TM23_9ACTN
MVALRSSGTADGADAPGLRRGSSAPCRQALSRATRAVLSASFTGRVPSTQARPPYFYERSFRTRALPQLGPELACLETAALAVVRLLIDRLLQLDEFEQHAE